MSAFWGQRGRGPSGSRCPAMTHCGCRVCIAAIFLKRRRRRQGSGREFRTGWKSATGELFAFVSQGRRKYSSKATVRIHPVYPKRRHLRGVSAIDSFASQSQPLHAGPKASFFAADAAGVGRHDFEGCAEGYQPDPATYLRVMSRVDSTVLEDEKRFVSSSDTEVGLYRIVLNLK
jgi:hypothetical protein